ncbi:MAG: AAA family ATPase [Candidatus Dojkabacteria bacterium]
MLIIGITGTNAAGKGTVVDILKQDFGFKHLSVRDYLAREVKRRNLEVNRNTLIETANDIREKHSPSYIVEELYKEAEKLQKPVVIESIRTEGEVEALQKKPNFILIAVDADRKTRYMRSLKRNSETDHLTYKKFIETEEREMNSPDKGKQSLLKCIELADIVILNDGTIEDLRENVWKYIDSSRILPK